MTTPCPHRSRSTHSCSGSPGPPAMAARAVGASRCTALEGLQTAGPGRPPLSVAAADDSSGRSASTRQAARDSGPAPLPPHGPRSPLRFSFHPGDTASASGHLRHRCGPTPRPRTGGCPDGPDPTLWQCRTADASPASAERANALLADPICQYLSPIGAALDGSDALAARLRALIDVARVSSLRRLSARRFTGQPH